MPPSKARPKCGILSRSGEELYRELISPYQRPGQPAPPMLATHFHDLARLRLELEAWEHIRDAQIEERWRQSAISAYGLYLDETSLPRSARVSRLAPGAGTGP